MRLSSPIGLSVLLASPTYNVLVLAAAVNRSIFSQRCNDLCMALVRDATLSTLCQQVCDALQVEEGEPCIQTLSNTSDEKLTLMSYSSGHYIETASILAHVAEEADPEYLRFVEHLRLNDRGSPAACHSLDDVHYCLIRSPSMSLGLCLPDICDSASITEILGNISVSSSESVDAMVDDHGNGLDAPPTGQAPFAVVCGEESRLDADAGTVLALLFVCFLFSLAVAGTLLDIRKEARVVTRLQKHSVVGETTPEADVHAPGDEGHLAPLGSERATHASGEGAVQQGASEMLPETVEDETPAVNLETRTEEYELAGTVIGDARTSSRSGGVGALESNVREPLLGSSAYRANRHECSPPWWKQCLVCFSLHKNMGKLLAPPSSSNAFGALDGIRTLSNLWVILLHASTLSLTGPGGLTNAVDVIPFDGHGALSRQFEDAAQLLRMLSYGVGDVLSLSSDLCTLQSLVILPLIEHLAQALHAVLSQLYRPAPLYSSTGMGEMLRALHEITWYMENFTSLVTTTPSDMFSLSVARRVIHQGTLAVDTFFLMSGFLASITLLPILHRVQSGSISVSSWVLGRYWHRYLRLMPTTAFITLVIWQLFPLVSDGPTWWPFAEALKDSCRRDWWTEITFVQNLVPWPPRAVACVGVAWALGIEMQFFLGAVPLIALFHYYPRVGVATLLSIMAASCVSTLWFGFYQDVRFPLLHMIFGDPSSAEDWNEVYQSPWFRCPVYIIGVLCGMAWHTYLRGRTMSTPQRFEEQSTDDSLAAIDRTLVPVGFTTSALLMSLPVFGAYWADRDVMEVQIPAWADHLCLAFSRPAFASGVALVCGLCFCGRGCVVNWFLTLPVWAPLSRLTFCSYLVHPLLFQWLFYTRSVPYRYTTFEIIIAFLGVTGAAFILAAVVHLLVEAPLRNLESWTRKRSARKASRQ